MKIAEGLEHSFSIDSLKKERAVWAEEENLIEKFKEYFTKFNSGVAISLFPAAIILSFITLTITVVFDRFDIQSVKPSTLYCYIALIIICAASHFIIYFSMKREPFNSKLINGVIYAVATAILLWMFTFICFNNSIIASIIMYTATISIVTQTLYLHPMFLGFYIFGGAVFFAVVHIFDGKTDSFETGAILGIVIMSVMWFLVAYMRYYSCCRSIYNENIISAQNKRLDEIILQMKEDKEKLGVANAALERAYVTDRLTGLYNRWYWDNFVGVIADDCTENGKDVAVVMIDLDNFKNINDTYGHSMGDKCLVGVSEVVKGAINGLENTEIFRLGGEEFAIVSSSLDKAGILSVSNKILKDITNIKIEKLESMLTASIGVYIGKISSAEDVETHLSKADAQMYNAKTSGKNRISFSFE